MVYFSSLHNSVNMHHVIMVCKYTKISEQLREKF